MRAKNFKGPDKYFHLSIQFATHSIFKELSWVFIQKTLHQISVFYEIEIQALVMMDSHIHILILSHNRNENYFSADLLQLLKSNDSIERISKPITNHAQYLYTYRYIYRNPVEAGICKTVLEYPYSSLQGLLGKSYLYVQVNDQLGLIQNSVHVLNWLNEKPQFKASKLRWAEF